MEDSQAMGYLRVLFTKEGKERTAALTGGGRHVKNNESVAKVSVRVTYHLLGWPEKHIEQRGKEVK